MAQRGRHRFYEVPYSCEVGGRNTPGRPLGWVAAMYFLVVAMVGDHEGVFEQWMEAGEGACCELIFPEFVEAILRSGLLKFDEDSKTPTDLKIHEMCLLLLFGPAGFQPMSAPRINPMSLSGAERRVAGL